MKRVLIKLAVLLMVALLPLTASATPPPPDNDRCPTIQGGTITDSVGNSLSVGFDQYGYNYQAHLFVGTYDSSDRTLDGTYWGSTGDYVDDALIMKWSENWLANVDCTGDGKLDRGTSGVSLGWLTNEVVGDYDSDGNGSQDANYTDFVKIVWTGLNSPLWGEYTIIEEVYNDPAAGFTGLQLKVGAPGFGLNDQWTTLG